MGFQLVGCDGSVAAQGPSIMPAAVRHWQCRAQGHAKAGGMGFHPVVPIADPAAAEFHKIRGVAQRTGVSAATKAGPRLDHSDGKAGIAQPQGRRSPGKSRPDHRNVVHPHALHVLQQRSPFIGDEARSDLSRVSSPILSAHSTRPRSDNAQRPADLAFLLGFR